MLPIYKTRRSVFNYEEIPAGYYHQAMLRGGRAQRFWHFNKFAFISRKIHNGAKVLDFGCSSGSFVSVLLKQHDNIDVTGVDIGSNQIEYAIQNIAGDSPHQRVEFRKLQGNNCDIPFADHTFDYVTIIEVIEHLHPSLAHKMLSESRRVLKPTGSLLITTPNYRSLWPMIELFIEFLGQIKYHDQHISKFTPNSLVKFVESAGFKIIRAESIFMVAPFLASLSQWAAEQFMKVERRIAMMLGSLLVVQAQALEINELE